MHTIRMRSGRSARRMLVFIVAALSATLLAGAGTARAATWDGYFPGQISGCLAHNHRPSTAPDGISVYTVSSYYGWAEWRYGDGGSCVGYQWIRLHVTAAIPMGAGQQFTVRSWQQDLSSRWTQAFLGAPGGTIAPGTYDGTVLRASSVRLCSHLEGGTAPSYDALFYGTAYVNKEPFCG